ncbi:glycosyltransferase [Konateibacter massiliensis]|uniref:glycosyltransferase n=1 Tax=Konateibacter massiliensis TaxID=2002841 RepID=UPI000C157A3D|nr:glycosyltransferase [Konateibacter massiliensis]
MKILQVNTVCGTGSVGRIALDLYNVIENSGNECRIAYGRGSAPDGIKTVHVNSKLDFYSHVLYQFATGAHGFASTDSTKKLVEEIDKFSPDIIHLHNVHGFYLNIEIFFEYLKRLDKPVIWTLHDCWSFTGHCAYFDYVQCDKWKTGCHHCEQYKSAYPYGLLHDNSVYNYKRKKELFGGLNNMTIVTPSRWLENYVNQSFLKDYPVEVIYNGIDLEQFKPIEGELTKQYDNGQHIILGVANMWEARKGLKYFIELAKRLPKDYRIMLVGLSEKQKKELPANITGITRTQNVNELAQLYSLASVYVNATLEDNFPTTNLEALACGTPVITFATGGSVESVDEECGRVVPKGDIDELCEAIEYVCTHREEFGKCLEKAQKYNKNDRFEEYMDLYRKVYEDK